MAFSNDEGRQRLVELAAEMAAAYVSHNSLAASDLPKLIADIYKSLLSLDGRTAPLELAAAPTPAVSIRKSITPDFLVCLDDGLKFKSLKRHLAQLGMTPDEYRKKWGLPRDYPMVAPNYAATRSELAKKIGLGRKPVVIEAPPTKARRGKKQAA